MLLNSYAGTQQGLSFSGQKPAFWKQNMFNNGTMHPSNIFLYTEKFPLVNYKEANLDVNLDWKTCIPRA